MNMMNKRFPRLAPLPDYRTPDEGSEGTCQEGKSTETTKRRRWGRLQRRKWYPKKSAGQVLLKSLSVADH
jgi:hypothetical protein